MEVDGVQFGKLVAAVEQLASAMTGIQEDLSAQRGINSTLQAQLEETRQANAELKLMIRGPDGSSGLLGRIQSLEAKLGSAMLELSGLKESFASTRSTLIKLALIVGASASAGSAGLSRVLNLLGL